MSRRCPHPVAEEFALGECFPWFREVGGCIGKGQVPQPWAAGGRCGLHRKRRGRARRAMPAAAGGLPGPAGAAGAAAAGQLRVPALAGPLILQEEAAGRAATPVGGRRLK
eukprot:EG_transcript_12070